MDRGMGGCLGIAPGSRDTVLGARGTGIPFPPREKSGWRGEPDWQRESRRTSSSCTCRG